MMNLTPGSVLPLSYTMMHDAANNILIIIIF